jgi:GT2 family glycosyltransferase
MVPPKDGAGISIVLPTFNRSVALRANLDTVLAMDAVNEIVIVDDGSTDNTPHVLRELRDPRVRIVLQTVNRGLPATRNRGVAEARGDWILFAEDDCCFPRDYAQVLLREASEHHADVMGAPWVHAAPGEVEAVIAQGRANPGEATVMQAPSVFPAATTETPFISALALIRRAIFDEVRFDEGFRGSAYREETDFFIRSVRAGYRVMLTPATCSWQISQYDGGARRPRLRYEYWAVRNNWMFLRRHGGWLAERGYVGDPISAQAKFAESRLRTLYQGYMRANRSRRIARSTASAG